MIDRTFGIYLRNNEEIQNYFEEFQPDSYNLCILFKSDVAISIDMDLLSSFREIQVYNMFTLQQLTKFYPIQYDECSLPTRIMPGLFIGTIDMVFRVNLQALQIDFLVNMTEQTIPENIHHLHLPSVDTPSFDLSGHLKVASKQIFDYLKEGKKVMVFCHKGVSRSGAVILYVYCLLTHRTLEDGLGDIRSFYPKLQPNDGFMNTLKKLLHSSLLNPYISSNNEAIKMLSYSS
jgi:hypothetical protein